MTFEQCLMECAGTKELVAEFDRLNNTNLSMRGSAIDLRIDAATGRMAADIAKFTEFVAEFIYLPLVAEQK